MIHIQINSRLIVPVLLTVLSAVMPAGQWGNGPLLNTARQGAAAVELNGYIYVMGGGSTGGIALNTVERYNPSTGNWETGSVAPFSYPRINAAAIVFNGRIYLMGGADGLGEVRDEVECYDPLQNSWAPVDDMRRDREGPVAVLLNQKICVMGGIRENGQYVTEIEWYDDTRDDWEEAPTPLDGPRAVPFAASRGNTFYMFGGIFNVPVSDSRFGVVDSAWNFSWTSGPALQVARGSGGSAVAGDSLFMIGGITDNGVTGMVESFNFTTGQLDVRPAMSTARAGVVTVATADNKIFAIGGYTQTPSQPLNTVEIYSRTPTGIGDPPPPNLPAAFVQIKGYPNPFNGVIQLQVDLSRASAASLVIYDLRGAKIRTLHEGQLSAGSHTFPWDGRNELNQPAASGLYLAVLKAADRLEVFKVVYAR